MENEKKYAVYKVKIKDCASVIQEEHMIGVDEYDVALTILQRNKKNIEKSETGYLSLIIDDTRLNSPLTFSKKTLVQLVRDSKKKK